MDSWAVPPVTRRWPSGANATEWAPNHEPAQLRGLLQGGGVEDADLAHLACREEVASIDGNAWAAALLFQVKQRGGDEAGGGEVIAMAHSR